jgi:hypothetical protein
MQLKHIFIFLLIILGCAAATQAQSILIKGVVYKKISSEKLAEVLITNKKKKISTLSDNVGAFSIHADKGDTLLFDMRDYTPQVQIVNGYDMVVYMQPEVKLSEVTVMGQTKKQELNEVMGAYRSKGVYYNGKPPVLAMVASPITGLYELFGKTPGRARRFAAFAKREAEETTVDSKYNKALVMRVTGAPDSTATKFMQYYRPHYDEVKKWSDYDLINKIKKSYDGYIQNKDKIKEDKLFAPGVEVKP